MADSGVPITKEDIRALLKLLGPGTRRVAREALDLANADAVSLLSEKPAALPENVVVFHADPARVPASAQAIPCALFSPEMPLHNGVIVGSDEHPGLRCSRATCGLDVCPFALAACLGQVDAEERPALLGLVDEGEAFVDHWASLIDHSDVALNLLLAPAENDFSGALVSNDDRYVNEFLADLNALLVSLGKVDDEPPMRRHLSDLLSFVGPSGFRFSEDGHLPARRLLVVDHLGDTDLKGDDDKGRLLADHLGRIVDDRYVLLVGTQNEVSEVMRLGTKLKLAFGGHEIHLASTSPREVLDAYLSNLDDSLSELVDEQFVDDFMTFVKDRAMALPYKGMELADYLAKIANAKGRLTLPKDRFAEATLDEMLDSIVGLTSVKQTIRQLEKYARLRKRLEREGKELAPANMHMLFEGNPGTGKTMVARLVSKMLHRIGITRMDKCIEVSSKDLIAKYVGHTDKQVHEKVVEALGGVLFIDEAYGLVSEDGVREGSSGGFGKQALAELVKSMEDYKDDLIIIFAGYEHEMEELVNVNPGMRSRIGYTFKFDDYSVDELIEIFKLDAERDNLVPEEAALDRARDVLKYFRRFRSFGNGRFVAELVHKASVNHANRIDPDTATAEDLFTILEGDIPTRQEMFDLLDWKARSADELLEPIVGLESVKEAVRKMEKDVTYREEAAKSGLKLPDLNLNMLFRGNPGTGKTTVARIVGDVLYNIGAVPNNKFVEAQAKDLVSTLAGDAGKKANEVIESAMGGVLFIDEAYALLETSAGGEVLAALVKNMSDHRGELVVIFAGYSREMRQFVDRNPGLASRIGYAFDFEDYKPDELTEMFRRKMEAAGLKLSDDALAEAKKAFKYFHGVENFGNGRFVDQVMQETISKRAARFDGTDISSIKAQDMPTVEELCKVVAAAVYDPSDLSGDDALLRVARHEMGHAICRLARTGGTDIVMVTIEQEGMGALGYVQHKAHTVALPTSDDLKADMVSLLGGMAAEELFFGQYSAGNSSDLRQATDVAARYVGTYGMSRAGLVQLYDPEHYDPEAVHKMGDRAIDAMNEVLAACLADAKRAIEDNRAIYDTMVQVLMDEKTISGERVVELWNARTASE